MKSSTQQLRQLRDKILKQKQWYSNQVSSGNIKNVLKGLQTISSSNNDNQKKKMKKYQKQNYYYEQDSFGNKNGDLNLKPNTRKSTQIQGQTQINSNIYFMTTNNNTKNSCHSNQQNKSKNSNHSYEQNNNKSKIQNYLQSNLNLKNQVSFEQQQSSLEINQSQLFSLVKNRNALQNQFQHESLTQPFYQSNNKYSSNKQSILYQHHHNHHKTQQYFNYNNTNKHQNIQKYQQNYFHQKIVKNQDISCFHNKSKSFYEHYDTNFEQRKNIQQEKITNRNNITYRHYTSNNQNIKQYNSKSNQKDKMKHQNLNSQNQDNEDSRISSINSLNQRIKFILNRSIQQEVHKRKINFMLDQDKNTINKQNKQKNNPKNSQKQQRQSKRQIKNEIQSNIQIQANTSLSINNIPKLKNIQSQRNSKQNYFNKNKNILQKRTNHMKDFTFSETKYEKIFQKRQNNQFQNTKFKVEQNQIEKQEYKKQLKTPIKNEKSQNKSKILDYQIQKINTRIKASQQRKLRLNIQFKPFSVQKRDKSQQITVRSFFQKQSQKFIKKQALLSNTQYIKNQQSKNKINKISKNQQKQQIIKLQKCSGSSKQWKQKYMKIINKNIQYFKKSVKTHQTERLINNLKMQVELDQQFRNQKIGFQYYAEINESQKWTKVHKLILKDYPSQNYPMLLKIRQSVEKTKKAFKPILQDHNPFSNSSAWKQSVQQQNLSKQQKKSKRIKRLIQSFLQSQNHWQSLIHKKFDRNILQVQRFSVKNTLDMQNKGWIGIQDLVRFVNMGTSQFFRTRDFIMIYKRLIYQGKQEEYDAQNRKKIQYQQFNNKIFNANTQIE